MQSKKKQITAYPREVQNQINEQNRNLQKEQQMTKKNNIVNRYLNLKFVPENIEYQSLVSVSYYENYKGQNPNSPGKNILNIGEQHYTRDDGFDDFINFLNNLIKKNSYLNTCLDFVFETKFQRQEEFFQNKNLTELGSAQNSSISTLNGLRRLFYNKRRLKGFRVHETDTRQGFEGFYSSIILLLSYLEKRDDSFVKRNRFIPITGAFIYNIDNEKYINKENNQSEFWEMFILIKKEGILYKNKLSKFQKILVQDRNLSQQQRKYYQNQIRKRNPYNDHVIHFFESVLEYMKVSKSMMDALGFKDKTKLKEDIDSSNYVHLSPKGYYDYLEDKPIKQFIENYILKYKNMDKKFAKQLDNIDPDYFLDNPKDLIFVYFFLKYGYPLRTLVFYDIQTISRIFRKFNDSKGRFKSCDEENKSLRNIIVYSGNIHTLNINEFLGNLPRLRLLSEPISTIYGNKLYFEGIGNTKQVSPKLSFGQFRPLNIGPFRLSNSSELKFPTNFDYFGYNEKIINQLKQENNVQNYLQIEKKLEEREMKQKQERQLQEKAKIQRQRQMNKIYTMELNQFGTAFNNFNGPGMFTGTLVDSKPYEGEIKFKNGTSFKGKYLSNSDSLFGVLTFTDGTTFKGTITKDNEKKYEGRLSIQNKDLIRGVFDSYFNIVKSKNFDFKIDDIYFSKEDNYVNPPDEIEDKITEQKMKQISKQLFKKENINYRVLKQFSDNLRLQYKF